MFPDDAPSGETNIPNDPLTFTRTFSRGTVRGDSLHCGFAGFRRTGSLLGFTCSPRQRALPCCARLDGDLLTSIEARLADAVRARRQRRAGVTVRDRSRDGAGKVALVTGASSGIGRAYANLLAAKGFHLVLVARREHLLYEVGAELEAKWGASTDVIRCDLRSPDAVSTLLARLDARDVTVDYLVNNAGYSMIGCYLDSDWEEHETFIRAMTIAPAELCYGLLPGMVARKFGRIVNVTSVAALYAGSPQMTLYGPAKSFMLKFSESLAEEYSDTGVHITATVPGGTDTEFLINNQLPEFGHTLMAQLPMMRAETVARQSYEACERRKRVVIHGAHHKALMFLAVHTPPKLRYGFVRAATRHGLKFDHHVAWQR